MSDAEPVVPPDRTIRMWGEACSTGLWSTEGYPIWPEDLPISSDLQQQLHAWAAWYDELDGLAPRQQDPWEGQPGMPTAAFSTRTRELAYALKGELPPEWTVRAWDVDSWRYGEDGQRDRMLELPGSPG